MTRYQLDSAEAPELPPVESLRRASVGAPETQSSPTPAVNNPIAAAIVDEAYAERMRQAQAVEGPAPANQTPALEPQNLEPVGVSEEPAAMSDGVADKGVREIEAPTLAGEQKTDEGALETPYTPQYEQAEAVTASLVTPAAVLASQAYEAPPVAASTGPEDDFEALLKQMDETLKLIKSVRSQAA